MIITLLISSLGMFGGYGFYFDLSFCKIGRKFFVFIILLLGWGRIGFRVEVMSSLEVRVG